MKLFNKFKKSKKKHEELLDDSCEPTFEAIVPWFFENIPFSFESWLRLSLSNRADQTWSLGDDITVDATVENIEYYLKHPRMTKNDKLEKVAGVVRSIGVKQSQEFTSEMFDQLEVYALQMNSPSSQRKTKQIHKDANASPATLRKRSASIY